MTEKRLLDEVDINAKSEQLNLELSRKTAEMKGDVTLSDYRVGPEDLLDVNIFQMPELDLKARVSANGYIGLPLIGKVKAGGLTIAELEDRIVEKYIKYLQEPVVNILVVEYRSQQILVLGSVKNPTVYFVSGQVNLLDVLSLAGGLAPDAGDVCVVQKIIEDEESGTRVEKVVVDLNELLVNGASELNIPISSGDVVHVLKSGIFFVDGAVNSAGSFTLKGKITLTQAISMAKGMSYEAIDSKIKIFRDNGKPSRDVIMADYGSILNGESEDLLIVDKDVIIVPTSEAKRFFRGFATSMSFGVFRFGKGF